MINNILDIVFVFVISFGLVYVLLTLIERSAD